MELQTAIEILEYHQEWRLGKREDMIHEPKKLTEALDIVLSEVKKFRLGAVSGQLPPNCSKCGRSGYSTGTPFCTDDFCNSGNLR